MVSTPLRGRCYVALRLVCALAPNGFVLVIDFGLVSWPCFVNEAFLHPFLRPGPRTTQVINVGILVVSVNLQSIG